MAFENLICIWLCHVCYTIDCIQYTILHVLFGHVTIVGLISALCIAYYIHIIDSTQISLKRYVYILCDTSCVSPFRDQKGDPLHWDGQHSARWPISWRAGRLVWTYRGTYTMDTCSGMLYTMQSWCTAVRRGHWRRPTWNYLYLSFAQRKTERIMLGITLRDHKHNTWRRHQTGVNDIIDGIKKGIHACMGRTLCAIRRQQMDKKSDKDL